MSRLSQETWRAWREDPCERTFEPLYEETKSLVWTLCKRVLDDDDDTLDAFQSAYGRLVAEPDALPSAEEAPEIVARFLSRHAIREADAARKRRGRLQKRVVAGVEESELDHQADSNSKNPFETAERIQMKEKLEAILGMLKEKYRTPVLLHYFDGMTHQEIADALGAPAKTISTRIARALRQLEPIMRDAGLGEGIAGIGILAGASSLAMPPASATASVVFTGAQSMAIGIGAGGVVAGASGGSLGAKFAAATAWLGTKAGLVTSGMAVGVLVLLSVAFRAEPPKPPAKVTLPERAAMLAQATPAAATDGSNSVNSTPSVAAKPNLPAAQPAASVAAEANSASDTGKSESAGSAAGSTSGGAPKVGLILSATSASVLEDMTDRMMFGGGQYFMFHRLLMSSVKASGVDLYIIVEPGTQENAEIKTLLETQRLTEKVIQGDDKEALGGLDSIVAIYTAGLPDEMLANLMAAVKSGVGFGILGDFCSIKPGPSDELNDFVGMKQEKGLYKEYQRPMNLQIVAPQEMLIGYFGTITEYPITIASGYTGMVEGTPLLELPSDVDADFCPMFMREYGKGRMMVIQMITDPMNTSAMVHVITLSRYVVNWISKRPLDSNWTRKGPMPQVAAATATPAVIPDSVVPNHRIKVGLVVSKLSRLRMTESEANAIFSSGQEDFSDPDDKRVSPKVILGMLVAGRLQFLNADLRAVIEPDAATDKRVVEFLESTGLDDNPIEGSSVEELKELDVVLAFDCPYLDGSVVEAILEAVSAGGLGFLAVGKTGVADEADRPALKSLIGAENNPTTLQIINGEISGDVPEDCPIAGHMPVKMRTNVPLTVMYCYGEKPDGIPALVVEPSCSGYDPVYVREIGEGRVMVASAFNVGVRGNPMVLDADEDPGVNYFRSAINWLAGMPPLVEAEPDAK